MPDGMNLKQELVKQGWCWWYRKYVPVVMVTRAAAIIPKPWASMALWRCAGSGLLREEPRHHEPREHREDDAANHGRKQLRARQPGPLKQRVQHAAHSRSGPAKHKAPPD
jgi:hypothetical protein